MKEVFADCTALKEMPDISNWDTSSVIDFTRFFGGFHIITELPDISKWNLSNCKNISYFFECCKK